MDWSLNIADILINKKVRSIGSPIHAVRRNINRLENIERRITMRNTAKTNGKHVRLHTRSISGVNLGSFFERLSYFNKRRGRLVLLIVSSVLIYFRTVRFDL